MITDEQFTAARQQAYGRHEPWLGVDCDHVTCTAPCTGARAEVIICRADGDEWPCEVARAYSAGLAARSPRLFD